MDAILGLDRQALERARLSRDPRFDGKFFIAVTSTGIYCRPDLSVADLAPGERALLRHRRRGAGSGLPAVPALPAGGCAWHAGMAGTSAVVQRALRLIEDGALDEDSVDALANRVGLGARHLDRLFKQHVGASPLAVAQTRRLHFAKRLLDDTDLSITEIALAAGYGSLRRFNYAFRASYGCAPRELRRRPRRAGLAPAGDGEVVLRLAYRPPYDWNRMCRALATRAWPGVERVDAQGYARTVRCAAGCARVQVRALAGIDALECACAARRRRRCTSSPRLHAACST